MLAVGAYGEVSRGVDVLLRQAADYRATRSWRRFGYSSYAAAYSGTLTELYAVCGVAFVREQAHLLHRRLHLAMPVAVAERHRNAGGGALLPPEGHVQGFARGMWRVGAGGL